MYAVPVIALGKLAVVIVKGELPGGVTVTAALANFVGSATLVTVTVTFVVCVTDGAVNSPEVEMVPAEVDHVTEVSLEFVTVALNCNVLEDCTVSDVGEIEI